MLPRRSPLGNESAGDNAGTTERETRMAVYDLEEQEKLDDLKAWWNQWGNLVSGVVIAVALGVFAVQGWRWWQGNQAEQAVGAVQRRQRRREGERCREGEGSGGTARGTLRRHGLRAARGTPGFEADVRCRRRGGRDGPAAIRARPRERGRAEADRPHPAGGDPVRRRNNTTTRCARSMRSATSRSPACTRTCAATSSLRPAA